jgi:phage major head subunit gpT-like protein
MGTPIHLLSPGAARRLEEFAENYAAALALGPINQWAKELGLFHTSDALKTTWHVPVSAAGYREFLGDIKYRSLLSTPVSLTSKTYQDGVAELAKIIEAPDFIGWGEQPAAIALEGERLLNDIIAAELVANPVGWDGKPFFAPDHPANVFDGALGTIDNDITGAGTEPSVENLVLAKQNFRAIKGPNGKPMGWKMTHVLAPSDQEDAWDSILKEDLRLITIGSSFGVIGNRHKGTVTPIYSDELTGTEWYPLALNKPGIYPWVVTDNGVPEEIRHDKDSHLYKTTLKVAIAYIKEAAGKLILPHVAQRWEGTP